jgi:hypothetical protein
MGTQCAKRHRPFKKGISDIVRMREAKRYIPRGILPQNLCQRIQLALHSLRAKLFTNEGDRLKQVDLVHAI